MTAKERVAALRRLMRKENLTAYLVPSTDPHQDEYVPDCWKRREWLSGFTGSAGDVVVTLREAGLWADSRYFLQAERELDPSVFRLFKVGTRGTPGIGRYVASKLKKGQAIGVDPRVVSKSRAKELERVLNPREIRVRFLSRNLVDRIWEDRPGLPRARVARHADRFAGQTVQSKLSRLREEMKKLGAEAHIVTTLDSIAWLFNIRGGDIDYNPLTIAYAIITRRGASLYLDSVRIPSKLQSWMRGFARLHPYGDVATGLKGLARKRACVLVDPARVDRWVLEQLKGARLIFETSPIVKAMVVKNPAQIRGTRRAHVRDGVALVRFLHWLEKGSRPRRLTERRAAARLEAFRAQGRHYKGPSFDPIVAYGPNGAVVHYSPATGINSVIGRRGLLLFDTGGHYLDGTTDVTRTITIGEPTAREKRLFTRVLQGHIALARAVLPPGVAGGRLEVLARQPLWAERADYGHGTGHGVGHYLNVHESPVGFSPRSPGVIEAGNILSIEPGHYEAGRFGIRTENLVVVVPEKKHRRKGEKIWLRFDELTMCPIDMRLVESSLMCAAEVEWLNAYHARVRGALWPHLDADVRAWLEKATRPYGGE